MKKEQTTKKPKTLPLKISPSQWQTWGKCALSLQNPPTTLRPDADDYAAQGINLHALIADALQVGDLRDPAMYGDDAEIVRFAVNTTLTIFNQYAGIEVEQYLSAKIAGVSIGGTADCIISEDDTVVIIDHKTGWKEVEAEGNKQLKLYAHLYAEMTKGEAITKWKGVIINARFGSTSYTGGTIDQSYLSTVAADVKKRTADKQYATGNHCAYCPRLTICTPIRFEIKIWLEPGIIDGLTRRPEELSQALRLAKPAEKLFDTIKKEAQLYIDLGGVIPGVTTEYTAGTRAWPRDLTTVEIAERIGIDAKNMIEESIISPAQAEKKGASKEAINALAIRPPRKGFKFV